MKQLLVATRSRGKQREFTELLAPLGATIVFPDDLGILESDAEVDLECFDTFEANARAKAEWFATRVGMPTLADDSGLEVATLNGAPGVLSKRFAGMAGPEELVAGANNARLLEMLAGLPPKRRTARYRCALVLVRSDGDPEIITGGAVAGRILDAPRGAGGFGYDPLFLSDELGITFAEATSAEKARVSHRARAAAALIERLQRS
ncbi:MAG TPA: non-canonical purine NTP pyrophosphatase [Gemmatimonadales bacterium]|nr:non-canonical purine NTP pyrophosphatase [Gemmatimonadales bacterium]